jgi:hypothetical protein
MGGTAVGIVVTSLAEAQGAIDRVAHLTGVGVFLAVVLPPANRAQSHGCGRLQRLEAAAWAAEKSSYCPHGWIDVKKASGFTLSTPRWQVGSRIS